jgi:hypothetical protein
LLSLACSDSPAGPRLPVPPGTYRVVRINDFALPTLWKRGLYVFVDGTSTVRYYDQILTSAPMVVEADGATARTTFYVTTVYRDNGARYDSTRTIPFAFEPDNLCYADECWPRAPRSATRWSGDTLSFHFYSVTDANPARYHYVREAASSGR